MRHPPYLSAEYVMQIDEPLFTRADVCAVVGISDAVFADWLRKDRDVFKPEKNSYKDNGRTRLFSANDVLRVGVMHELAELHIPPKRAAIAADKALERVKELYDVNGQLQPCALERMVLKIEDSKDGDYFGAYLVRLKTFQESEYQHPFIYFPVDFYVKQRLGVLRNIGGGTDT